MPKTENAFALKNFDIERILQRPFFLYRLGTVLDDTDEEFLDSSFNVAAISHLGTLKMKQRLMKVQRLKAMVVAYTKKFFEHELKIEKFMQRDTVDDEIGKRAEFLQQKYLSIIDSLGDLQKKINRLIIDGEKAISKVFCKELGERIKKARETLRLERKDVAFTLGISLNTLGQYERGERELSPYTLARLSEILRRSANWLLGFTA